MSKTWPGGLIRRTPVTPAGPFQDGSAPGVWTLAEASYWTKQGLWPIAGNTLTNWLLRLGGASSDTGRAVAVDGDGNIYVAGSTISQGAGSNDAFIAKISPTGSVLWQRALGATGADTAIGVALDSSANVYICGYEGTFKGLVAKYDTNGTLQWQRTIVGPEGAEFSQGIAVSSGGDVYVCGNTNTYLTVFKYNTSGTLQWSKTSTTGYSSNANAICVDSSGNCYVFGWYREASTGQPYEQFILLKYNTSGVLQFQRLLGTNIDSDFGYGITLDTSGNIYTCGIAQSNYGVVAKYNSSGTLQWQRTLVSSPGADTLRAITTDAAGDVYVAGYSSGSGNIDALIIKYNTSGTLQWQRTLAGSATDTFFGVAATTGGNIVAVGYSDTGSAGSNDIFIARLPSNGSKTGTYGPFTYAASSLTDSAGTLTASTPSLVDSTWSATSSTGTLTSATTTLGSTLNAV